MFACKPALLIAGLFYLFCGSVCAGEVVVTSAWINEAPPVSRINAGYFSIMNKNDKALVLDSVSSVDFERVEIHHTLIVDGTARMQKQSSLEIAANSSLDFSPGGYHLMLFSAKHAMRAGMRSSFVLHFSDGDAFRVEAEVRKLTAEHSHHH